MAKKSALFMALIVSLIVLAQPVGGIGCLVKKSAPGPLITTASETVYAQMEWLNEQKFEEPNPPTPLNVNLSNVESETTRIDLGQGTGGGGDSGGGDSGGGDSGGGDSGGGDSGGGDSGGGDGGSGGGGGGGG